MTSAHRTDLNRGQDARSYPWPNRSNVALGFYNFARMVLARCMFKGTCNAFDHGRLPFANVGTAVHVQHLAGDVRSLGQINHGIHNLLDGRNAPHWG